ncbi:PTS lactose/cellobiose transporter subunit IIA [Oceanotoga sp. DSM 15011]|jgi:PTS system cellobiose-specific IIA component|uniref:PTS lactose/cellobiose transporter subunit IIA n=1 Tax=Oceanotoga sp. DSM 15011 TaxID=2984951 RepID=UPI0021F445B9|nr:PTS lactose/cellobiose transporter subunit IIA [Oceanotoga sp. DSM 15011]UYP01230.1 PTS lactose/cellobiose transporter subunit IIA [Oceanotoga sp. DSM 15011]
MEDNNLINSAMNIIINAGDSRLHITEALNEISKNNYLEAKEKLKLADEKMIQAHRIQTDIVQKEADGTVVEYSVLFTHAQDTLMTIKSELDLAKNLFKVFQSFEERLSKLEKGVSHDEDE